MICPNCDNALKPGESLIIHSADNDGFYVDHVTVFISGVDQRIVHSVCTATQGANRYTRLRID